MKIKSGFLSLSPGKIYYRIAGEEEPQTPSAGPLREGTKATPLLCLHGGPGGSWDYLEPLQELSDERAVIFYDQLGSGRSSRPRSSALYTVDYFVEELAEIIGQLKLKRFHLLGQSWGSMLAVAYYLQHRPSGLSSLILSGPFLSAPRFAADQRGLLARLSEKTRTAIMEAEARRKFDTPLYREAMDEFYRHYLCRMDPWPQPLLQTFKRMGAKVYQKLWGPSEFTATGILKDTDYTPRLGEIEVPTLFTAGEFDEATPETAAYYQSLIKGSKLKVLENTSHSHHLEAQSEFLSAVRDFLHKVE